MRIYFLIILSVIYQTMEKIVQKADANNFGVKTFLDPAITRYVFCPKWFIWNVFIKTSIFETTTLILKHFSQPLIDSNVISGHNVKANEGISIWFWKNKNNCCHLYFIHQKIKTFKTHWSEIGSLNHIDRFPFLYRIR